MLKKMSVGAWITCCAAILIIVSLIVYSANVSGEGYFQGRSVNGVTLWLIIAAVLLVCAIALKLLNLKGSAATSADLASGLMQIGAPVLVALSLINLIASRVEGLGFIYFSNADVIKEVQTPANMASGTGAIASMVVMGVALVVAIVAAFCGLRKKEAK